MYESSSLKHVLYDIEFRPNVIKGDLLAVAKVCTLVSAILV